jgi:hypothetical protein
MQYPSSLRHFEATGVTRTSVASMIADRPVARWRTAERKVIRAWITGGSTRRVSRTDDGLKEMLENEPVESKLVTALRANAIPGRRRGLHGI